MTKPFRNAARMLAAAGLLAGAASASDYLDLRRIEPLAGDAAAGEQAAAVCAACHGADGVSVVPMFPSLAGQPAEYLYYELLRYRGEPPPASAMTPIVATLDDKALRDLSVYYANLPAATAAAPVSDPAAFDRGAVLFAQGDPAQGIPPCQGCHGVGGNGLPRDGSALHRTYPMLRHQPADYLIVRLKEYRDTMTAHSSNDFVMQAVAGRLDDEAIASLAAWLASAP